MFCLSHCGPTTHKTQYLTMAFGHADVAWRAQKNVLISGKTRLYRGHVTYIQLVSKNNFLEFFENRYYTLKTNRQLLKIIISLRESNTNKCSNRLLWMCEHFRFWAWLKRFFPSWFRSFFTVGLLIRLRRALARNARYFIRRSAFIKSMCKMFLKQSYCLNTKKKNQRPEVDFVESLDARRWKR